MEKNKTRKSTNTNKTAGKRKVNKKKKETIDVSLEAIVYFMMSAIIFLSLFTNLLSNFGTMMKYVFAGQFAKVAFIIPTILLWIAILKFRNAKNMSKYYLIQILLFVATILLYGSLSFGLNFTEKINLELIKGVYVESIIGENIGIWAYLTTYFLSKFIGKLGMFILAVAILGFVIFKYTNLSFENFREKIIQFFGMIFESIKSLVHNFNNRERKPAPNKVVKPRVKNENIGARNIHNIPNKSNDFDFLEKYKQEIAEMPDFSFEPLEENEIIENDEVIDKNETVENKVIEEEDIDVYDDFDFIEKNKNTEEEFYMSVDDFSDDEEDFIKEYSDEYIDEVLFSNNTAFNGDNDFKTDYEDYYDPETENISTENVYDRNITKENDHDRTKIYRNLSEKIKAVERKEIHKETENDFIDEIDENLEFGMEQYSSAEIDEKIIDLREIYTEDKKEKENIESLVIQDSKNIKRNINRHILPNVDILKKYIKKENNEAQNLRDIEKLETTLRIFGVEAKVVNVSMGPTITRFELQPKMGVKVSKILNLSDDLSLALAAVAPIRIEAPIPGTSLIGIEVPNAKTEIVSFREMIEAKEFANSKGKLPITLGKDVSGKAIIDDIAKMPHLLVAGSTGSGKSVCINTLICSILFKSFPEDVKMIMIDPKMVELSVYNDIPHLLVPVVTDMKKAPYALSWAVNEMNNRYKLLAENRVRDIEGYNDIHKDEKLPRIVVIVDELADLMMVSPHEVEDSIIRLAQKARACGIHLVIATQRPSVDVITGLIKANIPTRIAFAVSSQIDSRTILDQSGAEKLIGKGDMLYYHPSQAKPHRIQGPFISDDEVNNIVDFLSKQNFEKDSMQNDIIEETIKTTVENQKKEDRDELLDSVIEFVSQNKEVSTSLIQRRFRIGYNRASRIIDELEEMGIVSESNGAKGRKVLINTDEV